MALQCSFMTPDRLQTRPNETFISPDMDALLCGDNMDLGFLLRKENPQLRFNTQLLAQLLDIPSELHYDPQHIHLPTVDRTSSDLRIARTGIAQTSQDHVVRVVAGQATLSDRKGKQVNLLTLGGQAAIARVSPNETRVLLQTDDETPIFDYQNPLQALMGDIFLAQVAREKSIASMTGRAAEKAFEVAYIKTPAAEHYHKLLLMLLETHVHIQQSRELRRYAESELRRLGL